MGGVAIAFSGWLRKSHQRCGSQLEYNSNKTGGDDDDEDDG